MVLELRTQLCTFENSTKCNEISFDQHSFSEYLKGLFSIFSEFDNISFVSRIQDKICDVELSKFLNSLREHTRCLKKTPF